MNKWKRPNNILFILSVCVVASKDWRGKCAICLQFLSRVGILAPMLSYIVAASFCTESARLLLLLLLLHARFGGANTFIPLMNVLYFFQWQEKLIFLSSPSSFCSTHSHTMPSQHMAEYIATYGSDSKKIIKKGVCPSFSCVLHCHIKQTKKQMVIYVIDSLSTPLPPLSITISQRLILTCIRRWDGCAENV